jgi:hypothetical protein
MERAAEQTEIGGMEVEKADFQKRAPDGTA